MRILSVGEILWDVFPDGERLGGAPFNFAAHAARLSHEAIFLSAVGDDDRGRAALRKARELGVTTEYLQTVKDAPTGYVSVEVDSAGVPSFTIHRPAAYDLFRLSPEEIEKLAGMNPEFLAFGTLHQTTPEVKAHTQLLMEACSGARRFYDVNLRRDSYNPFLLEDLMLQAEIVKLNETEMEELNRLFGISLPSMRKSCEYWRSRYGWAVVAVTLGEKGCIVLGGEEYVEAPGYPVTVADTVGSGDAFSAAFIHGLAEGWPLAETADFANRVGALVASRPGAVPEWTVEEARALRRS